jgi:hypothetical protein
MSMRPSQHGTHSLFVLRLRCGDRAGSFGSVSPALMNPSSLLRFRDDVKVLRNSVWFAYSLENEVIAFRYSSHVGELIAAAEAKGAGMIDMSADPSGKAQPPLCSLYELCSRCTDAALINRLFDMIMCNGGERMINDSRCGLLQAFSTSAKQIALRLIIHPSIDLNVSDPTNGQTVLMHAVASGYPDLVDTLLSRFYEIDFDMKDNTGRTAMAYAAAAPSLIHNTIAAFVTRVIPAFRGRVRLLIRSFFATADESAVPLLPPELVAIVEGYFAPP